MKEFKISYNDKEKYTAMKRAFKEVTSMPQRAGIIGVGVKELPGVKVVPVHQGSIGQATGKGQPKLISLGDRDKGIACSDYDDDDITVIKLPNDAPGRTCNGVAKRSPEVEFNDSPSPNLASSTAKEDGGTNAADVNKEEDNVKIPAMVHLAVCGQLVDDGDVDEDCGDDNEDEHSDRTPDMEYDITSVIDVSSVSSYEVTPGNGSDGRTRGSKREAEATGRRGKRDIADVEEQPLDDRDVGDDIDADVVDEDMDGDKGNESAASRYHLSPLLSLMMLDADNLEHTEMDKVICCIMFPL